MVNRLLNFIYKHELLIGISGLIISFWLLLIFSPNFNTIKTFPLGLGWLSVFFVGDYLNRVTGEGSIFPHRKDQKNKIKNLIMAAFLMNVINDLTGTYLIRLWYYPYFNPVIYLLFLVPIGYVIYGIILYVFYRLFKKNFDDNVSPGRMSKIKAIVYKIIINAELIIGIVLTTLGLNYLLKTYYLFNVKWFEINRYLNMSINIWYPILMWFGLFFIMEFICYFLGRETLTRDLIRGNFVPFISIILASLMCVLFVEVFNYPFQIWAFANWPMDQVKLLNIPLIAYLVWPMQYLILLPLIRIFDGKNIENVW